MTGAVQSLIGTAAAAGARATVTAAPTTDSESCSSTGSGTCNILAGPFTATPSGGNGNFSYQWELVSTNASGVAFGTGTSPSTTVTVTGTKALSPGATYTTVVRCRVSSPGGADVFSNNVTITSTHTLIPVVQLSNQTFSDVAVDPTDAAVRYTLESDGDIIRLIRVTSTDIGDWVDPKAAAPGLYEVFAQLNSGSLDAGSSATGTWLPLTSTRFWGCTQIEVGTKTANLTISIRNNGGPTEASCTVSLSAEVTV